jgi:splicing factor 3A subunit 3
LSNNEGMLYSFWYIFLLTLRIKWIQCSAHEDIERLEQAIVDQYMEDAKTHRERLYNEHVVDKFLSRIAEKSQSLYDLYEDKSG